MKSLLVIDRFEGDWGVVEYEDRTFNLPRRMLPPGIKEGDVVVFDVSVDDRATADRAREIEDLAGELFKDQGR